MLFQYDTIDTLQIQEPYMNLWMDPLGDPLTTRPIQTGWEFNMEPYPSRQFGVIDDPDRQFGNGSVCTRTRTRSDGPEPLLTLYTSDKNIFHVWCIDYCSLSPSKSYYSTQHLIQHSIVCIATLRKTKKNGEWFKSESRYHWNNNPTKRSNDIHWT